MEEILTKDIFIENDLLKHGPDYCPQDIVLRMQLRRVMARVTHKHGVSRYSLKKNIRKKNCHKLKKEIVKLRTYFENMNLQNQSTMKEIERISNKTKNYYKAQFVSNKKGLSVNDENELIRDEMSLYMSQSSDDKINLAIENDNDFKLLVKEKPKLRDDINYARFLKSNKCDTNVLDCKESGNQNNTFFTNKQSNTYKILNGLKNESVGAKLKSTTIDRSVSPLNEVKNDLQSILIMMTINSNMDEHNIQSNENLYEAEKDVEDTGTIISKETSSIQKFETSNSTPSQDLITLLNITSVGKNLNYREKYIIKKYIRKWKLYITTKKDNLMYKQRQETLNNFFNKLSKKKNHVEKDIESARKAKILARDYETYQHRYKVQKHIIALQKSKLEEQNKLIEKLKYNNIVESSRQSLDAMKEDVRKTYYEIDKHLKPKIKCLTNELKISELEEPSLVLHCLKVPQFLQRMEKRAREREEKHAMIRERRKQLEEERIKQKQQAELAKLEIDKEEKIKRIKELRDKRKKEKIENIRKKQHVERLRALIVMADLHYERSLMKNYGIRPLRRLLEIKHINVEKAKAHYRIHLLNNVFLHWMWHTEDMWFERNYKAENFHRKKTLRKFFEAFKKNHHDFVLKRQVAEDYYDLYVTQIVFKKFTQGIGILKKEFELKWNNAVVYYNSNILFKTFTCWRTLPALNALKREQDARKLRWREKVLLVVPDYKPPED